MKRLLMIFAVLLILSRCTNDEIDQNSFKLVEFMSVFTTYDTEYTPNSPFGLPSRCCVIVYKRGKVSKVIYKNSVPQPMNLDGTFPESLDSYDEFIYNGDKVTLTKKIDNFNIPYSPQKRELILDQKDRIICRIAAGDTTDFFYSPNGLLSKSVARNGGYCVVEKHFLFDSNNNLVHIRGTIDNPAGMDYKIFEYFEDYDNAVNGFKNLGVIEGAFIRSLSNNNYSTYSCAIYDQNNSLRDTMRSFLPVTYGANGQPIYGICSAKKN